MTRLFVKQSYLPGDRLCLSRSQLHYLRDVLRLRDGEAFVVVFPDGREATARLTAEQAEIGEVGPGRPQPAVRVSLYAALTKHKSWGWMLEKATEVGAAEIVPLVTERSVVRPREDRLAAQVERWNKLAEAAGRQCQSPTVPPVAAPLEYKEGLAHWHAQGTPGLLLALPTPEEPPSLWCRLRALPGAEALALFVGPEGDFSPTELSQARAAGLLPTSLGPRVLRAETAAVVAAALCLYELGRPAQEACC